MVSLVRDEYKLWGGVSVKNSSHATSNIAFIMVIVGLLLVIVGQSLEGKFDFGKISISVGSSVIFIGVLHWLYDTFSKKELMSEITEVVMGSKSLVDSGVSEYFEDSTKVNFRESINNSASISTVFNYNTRFVLDYSNEILDLLKRGGCVTLIFLEKDSSTLNHLKSLGLDGASMEAHYKKMQEVAKWGLVYPERFKIVYVDKILKYSVVVLDSATYFIFSTSSNQRQRVPVLKFKSRSPLSAFVISDIDKLT